MTSKRKSFLVYKDSLSVLDELTNEQAGLLIKAMKSYHDGEELNLDALTKIVFSPFKAQFERDAEKYEKIVERNRGNGSKGGRPKNPEEPKKPSGFKSNPENPSKADSDSDSDSDSDIKSIVSPAEKRNFSDGDMAFVDGMLNLLTQANPKFKLPNKEKWANTIRLMRERDGLNHDEMAAVFTWANNDHFWSSNILSADKFRSKWNTLFAQSTKKPKNQVNNSEDWNDDDWHKDLGM
mgnify:CR=1 FL=1